MTPQDRQNYGEGGNITIMAATGAVVLSSPLRFCKLVTLASTTFTALVDQFEGIKGVAGAGAVSQTYPANFELVGSFTAVHCATGGVRAIYASDRK